MLDLRCSSQDEKPPEGSKSKVSMPQKMLVELEQMEVLQNMSVLI